MSDKSQQEKFEALARKSAAMKTACELIGNNRILIENHCGILGYNPCCIRVRTEYGTMQILGDNLNFDFMSRTRLLIKGNVVDIKLIERGC